MTKTLKATAFVIGLAFAVSAHAQTREYPLQPQVAKAEARVKTAAAACLKELKGGKSGPACGRYHAAAVQAMTMQGVRQTWCHEQMSGERVSEQSNFRIADSCLTNVGQNLQLEQVEGLERKVDKNSARKFDHDLAGVAQ